MLRNRVAQWIGLGGRFHRNRHLRGLAKYFQGDLNAAEIARVLRIPGTLNHKSSPPRPVEILQLNGNRCDLTDFDKLISLEAAAPQHSSSSKNISETIQRIMECTFMKHCDRDRTTLAEPEWYAMITQLATQQGGPDKIHELSRGYPKYSAPETDRKTLHAINDTGPITCTRIKELWNCGNDCGVKSPASLAWKKSVSLYETEPVKGTSSVQFPDIMTGFAGNFAGLYGSYLEVPREFFFIGALTCLGSFVADRVTLASEISPQPRLFGIFLGESADERKSTGLNKTVDFFRSTLEDFHVCFGIGSAEGLQLRLEGKNKLLLCFDEFKQFIAKCKIEASVLLPCVNTLFESNHYESRTKTTDIQLNNIYLSMLAASTVQTYERIFDSNFIAIGFNNRLLLVPGSAERRHSFPARVPEGERKSLQKRLGEVIRHVSTGLELDITPPARDRYHDWYMNLERSVHAKRLDVYAMRLMILLAVNELRTEVDEEVVEKVITFANWQLEVRRRYDPIDADSDIAKMEQKIRRLLNQGPFDDRQLKQLSNAYRAGLWIYDTAMKNLERAGEIRRNRTTRVWELV